MYKNYFNPTWDFEWNVRLWADLDPRLIFSNNAMKRHTDILKYLSFSVILFMIYLFKNGPVGLFDFLSECLRNNRLSWDSVKRWSVGQRTRHSVASDILIRWIFFSHWPWSTASAPVSFTDDHYFKTFSNPCLSKWQNSCEAGFFSAETLHHHLASARWILKALRVQWGTWLLHCWEVWVMKTCRLECWARESFLGPHFWVSQVDWTGLSWMWILITCVSAISYYRSFKDEDKLQSLTNQRRPVTSTHAVVHFLSIFYGQSN